jgi:hypothetical protein
VDESKVTDVAEQPQPAEVPAWELEVKPEFDGPMRGFLCPADDEEPPEVAGVPVAL